MATHIDDFQRLLTGYFRELVLATAYLEIGRQSIMQSPPNASVALTLAEGVTTEPMFLRELLPHSASVSLGVAELFQTKTIAAWADLLNALFEHFVGLHIEGKRQFAVFKRRTTRLDFSSSEDVTSQVRRGLVADFAFGKYADRIQMITRVLVPDERVIRELAVVRKHVAIRNATQHHAGKLYEEMLRELGTTTIDALDHAGNTLTLSVGQSIALYVPELDLLKSALFVITNQWKEQLV